MHNSFISGYFLLFCSLSWYRSLIILSPGWNKKIAFRVKTECFLYCLKSTIQIQVMRPIGIKWDQHTHGETTFYCVLAGSCFVMQLLCVYLCKANICIVLWKERHSKGLCIKHKSLKWDKKGTQYKEKNVLLKREIKNRAEAQLFEENGMLSFFSQWNEKMKWHLFGITWALSSTILYTIQYMRMSTLSIYYTSIINNQENRDGKLGKFSPSVWC